MSIKLSLWCSIKTCKALEGLARNQSCKLFGQNRSSLRNIYASQLYTGELISSGLKTFLLNSLLLKGHSFHIDYYRFLNYFYNGSYCSTEAIAGSQKF